MRKLPGMLLLNKYKISAGGDYLAQEKNQENFLIKWKKRNMSLCKNLVSCLLNEKERTKWLPLIKRKSNEENTASIITKAKEKNRIMKI